jgi:hypothetical protein
MRALRAAVLIGLTSMACAGLSAAQHVVDVPPAFARLANFDPKPRTPVEGLSLRADAHIVFEDIRRDGAPFADGPARLATTRPQFDRAGEEFTQRMREDTSLNRHSFENATARSP